MHVGDGVVIEFNNVKSPLYWFIEKIDKLFDFSFAQTIYLPDGSILKSLGESPPQLKLFIYFNNPVLDSI